jgi:hypothetical protein
MFASIATFAIFAIIVIDFMISNQSSNTIKSNYSSGSLSDKDIINTEALEATQLILEEMFKTDHLGYAKPLYLKNRTLTISCSNMKIAQEISLNQAKLVDQINVRLGKNEVDRIRYLA